MTVTKLFFGGSATPYLNEARLKKLACSVIDDSPLMRLVYAGDEAAIKAYYIAFWPFVHEFEVVIDKRGFELLGFRKALQAKFGNVIETIRSISAAVGEMKREEGVHATLWAKDAKHAGVSSLESDIVVPGVRELIESARTSPLWMHYCVLGGTEEIAVTLSERGHESAPFLSRLSTGRSLWSEVHLLPDPEGRPSHHKIDRDLAHALYVVDHPDAKDDEIRKALEDAEADTIRLFGKAADDVYRLFGLGDTPPQLIAAE